MSVSKLIRRIAYSQRTVRTSQFLGVRNMMRNLYFLLAKPKDYKKKIVFNGIEASFNVRSPLDLRLVETPFKPGMGDERELLERILDELNPDDAAYDIGASIGIHTVFMANKVGKKGRIISFEPENTSFSSLQENVELNSLHNIDLIKCALGDSFSEADLYSGGTTADFSLINKKRDTALSKVKVIPGDALVEERNLPLPDLIKIDVEGYEYSVIQGLKRTLSHRVCRALCCEVHPTLLPEGISDKSVYELLKSMGFKRIESHLRGKTIHAFCYKD